MGIVSRRAFAPSSLLESLMRRFDAERGGGRGGAGARGPRKSVMLEALEPRLLLSADVSAFDPRQPDTAEPTMLARDADSFGDTHTPQIVFLSTGGAGDVHYDGPVTVPAVDVTAFAAPGALAGEEAAILAALIDSVDDAFLDSDVQFTLERPDDGPYSTVHLGSVGGAFDAWGDFYGLAEQVDAGNADLWDVAFVFTDVIDVGGGFADYAASLAEVVLHETGHLLGEAHGHRDGDGPLADVAFDPKVHVEIGNDGRPTTRSTTAR